MNIDRKYKIHAVNPCSRNTHDEHDSILFLAKDKAVPAMLRAYLSESEKLGANHAHLESIELLIGRVEQYQREVEAKIPDTDLPCEIRRCVDGEGVSDNKQDLAPGEQPAPSVPEDFGREELEAVAAGLDTYEKTVNVGNVTGEGDDHLESTTAYAARFIRAKIAAMEQQKPARLVTPTAYRWRYRGAVKWQYGELTEEVARLAKEHNHEVQALYLAPGVKGEEK